MLALKPPVPTGTLEFERVFRSGGPIDVDQLMRLSAGRRALCDALVPLVQPGHQPDPDVLVAAIQATDAYRVRWLAFWRERIVRRGGAPTRANLTTIPVSFRWRIGTFHDQQHGSKEYIDPSPLAETVCVTLAAAICRQRAAAANVGGPAASLQNFAEANTLIQWIRDEALPRFRPWVRSQYSREPHFYADVFHEAVGMCVTGHSLCKEALLQSVRGEASVDTAVRLFRGAQKFQRAAGLLPGEPVVRAAQCRASASAYRYLAKAVADTTSHMGVAVACVQESVRLGALAGAKAAEATKTHAEYLSELERRNEAEAGYLPVPKRADVALQFLANQTPGTVTILTNDAGTVTIALPLRKT